MLKKETISGQVYYQYYQDRDRGKRTHEGLVANDRFYPCAKAGNRFFFGISVGDRFIPGILRAGLFIPGVISPRGFSYGIFTDSGFKPGVINSGFFMPGKVKGSNLIPGVSRGKNLFRAATQQTKNLSRGISGMVPLKLDLRRKMEGWGGSITYPSTGYQFMALFLE